MLRCWAEGLPCATGDSWNRPSPDRRLAPLVGVDAYPGLISKAAALLHSLVMNHALVDGNKRTAVLATLVFLDLNGYMVRWDQDEALAFMLRLAAHEIELDDVIAFLRPSLYPKAPTVSDSS